MNKRKKPNRLLIGLMAVSLSFLSACVSHDRNLTGNDFDASSPSSQAQENEKEKAEFGFTTTDMNGRTVTMEDFSSAKVIMFNMWEPWCGPCRGELPDLQKLYEKYRSQGVMIVGVFSDRNGVDDIVDELGLSYPMLNYCEAFDPFQSGYVPTTFFTDGSGKVISDESYIGSKSYEEWESIILSYLK